MTDVATLTFKVDSEGLRRAAADLDHLKASAGGAEKASERMMAKADAMASSFINAGKAASLFLTTPLLAAGGAAVKLALDAEETANKFDVVFRGSVEESRAALEALTATVPLTIAEMERMAGGIQDMLVPMGVARDEAAGMSASMIELAADMGSFNNVGTEQVLMDIQSALAGSSEPMRKYGVDTRTTRLEQIALRDGLIEMGGEMTTAATAAATLKAIMEDTADAHGDAANTVGSASNQLRLLQRDVKQLFEDLGKELIPVLDILLPKLRDGVAVFGDMSAETKATIVVIAGVVAAIGPLLVSLGLVVGSVTKLLPLVKFVTGAVTAGSAAFAAIGGAIVAAAIAIEREFTPGMEKVALMDQIVNVLMRAWVVLRETIVGVSKVVVGLAVTTVGAIRTIIAPIEGFVSSAASAVQAMIDRDFGAARDAVRGIGGEIAEAHRKAQEQIAIGSGFVTESVGDAVEGALTEVDELQRGLINTARESDDLQGEVAGFASEMESETRKGVQAMFDLAEQAGWTEAAMRDAKIETGKATGAMTDFETQTGTTTTAVGGMNTVLGEAETAMQDAETELENMDEAAANATGSVDGLGEEAGAVAGDLAGDGGLSDAAMDAGEAFGAMADTAQRALGDVKAAISDLLLGEIDNFGDFADRLAGIMDQATTEIVDTWVSSGLDGLMGGQGLSGFGLGALFGQQGAWFEGGQITEAGTTAMGAIGAIGGIAGGMIGGQAGGAVSGAAQGAMYGSEFSAVGTIIGSILGGMIGWMGVDRPPRWDLAGQEVYENAPAFRAQRPESFQTDLGTVWANFVRMDEEMREGFIGMITDFDAQIAQIVGDEWMPQTVEAIESFAFMSLNEGDDPSAILEARLSAILNTFDAFTQSMVQQEGSLEDRMQMFSDILNIRRWMNDGGSLGDLGFEEIAGAMNLLREGAETLGEAFTRISGGLQSYAQIVANLDMATLTDGMSDAQQSMVGVMSQAMQMRDALHGAADAAGLHAVRTEDLAKIHEWTAMQMTAIANDIAEAGQGIAEQLGITEAQQLAAEIDRLRDLGISDDDLRLAGLLDRQAEMEAEAAERERMMLAQELAQMVADFQTAMGGTFEEAAEAMSFDLGELQSILGLDDTAFASYLEDLQIDPMAVATEIQTMTDRIVGELILLPGEFAEALYRFENPFADDPTPANDEPFSPIGPEPGGGVPDGSEGQPSRDQNPPLPPDWWKDIGDYIGGNSDAMRSVGDAVTNLSQSREEVDQQVAEALTELAGAIRESITSGATRSSRTRATV
jgi:hypothetical protein